MTKLNHLVTPLVVILLCFSAHAEMSLALAGTGAGTEADADITPPPDPSQSITYWQPHIISPERDHRVAHTEEIFQGLLLAWNPSHV